MKILVTGASGFIGSALMRSRNSGFRFVGLYHSSAQVGANDSMSSPAIVSDLTSSFEFNEPVDAVVHLAARIPTVGDSQSIAKAADANRLIDDRVIEYCQRFTSTRLVFFSTSSIYNRTIGTWREDSEVSPDNDYSRQKLATEHRLQQVVRSFDIVRLNAPYGPKQPNETVVTRFIRQAIRNEPLNLFGDGSRKQAFTFIDDIISFIHRLLVVKPTQSVINIAGSELITMHELAKTVLSTMPDSGSTVEFLADANDPFVAIFPDIDCSKAMQLTGWRPTTLVRSGIEQTASAMAAEKSNQENWGSK